MERHTSSCFEVGGVVPRSSGVGGICIVIRSNGVGPEGTVKIFGVNRINRWCELPKNCWGSEGYKKYS